MPTERFTVTSKDGVEISVQKAGSGPALLLIHGAMLNGAITWGAVLPKLAEHFTVYAMDRRGRAPSGDTKAYTLANEADDVAAVLERIDGPAIVLGHSYGGLVLLDALERLRSVSHLILYEPALMLHPDESDVVAKLEQALQAGDREELVTIFLRDQVRIPPENVARMKSSPIWPVALRIAPTLPRESRTVNTYLFSPERLSNWKTPTTLLLGGVTVGRLRDSLFFLRDAISGCQLLILEGQGHGAMLDAPDFFAKKILEIAGAHSQPLLVP